MNPSEEERKIPFKKYLDAVSDHVMYMGSSFPDNPVHFHNE